MDAERKRRFEGRDKQMVVEACVRSVSVAGITLKAG
jgi:hypothetical protein